MEVINDSPGALAVAATLADRHPLVVYIVEDQFQVVEQGDSGGNVLFATERAHILGDFMRAWKYAHINAGEDNIAAYEGVANSQSRMGV